MTRILKNEQFFKKIIEHNQYLGKLKKNVINLVKKDWTIAECS